MRNTYKLGGIRMRHKTVERLVEKVRVGIETQLWAQLARPDVMDLTFHVIAHYRTKGCPVWSVEYDTCCWHLYHYGVLLLSYNRQTGKVNERVDTVSVSDQQGMNGFLNALGVNYYVSRAGRTARYV